MKKEEKKETKKVSTASVEKSKKKISNVVSKKETKKEKKIKVNIFKAIGKYFKGVAKETKRIKWTNGKELVKYSVASIMFVMFFGLYFYGIDWIALLVRSLAK